MEVSNRIKEFFGLHPDLVESDEPDVPSVALISDADSWTLVTYPGNDLSAEDRAWIWSELAAQAMLVLAQEVPEIQCRIITPAEFPDGTTVDGFVQYVFPPPGFAQRYWWNRMCECTPAISHLLSQRIEQRWLARGKRSNPTARINRQRELLAKKTRRTNNGHRGGMSR